ncbi:MAG: DUF3237 domain-containing protein [Oscillospiraceae bacterium]|nr:DUF3237 domain-containing protein [Oscillospiraceae bacterium]
MQLEEIMVVHVTVKGNEVNAFQGEAGGVVMIPFDATIDGKYFNGTVLPGGIDTQVIGPNGRPHTLSARYMAKGTDYTGEECFVYIENNGVICNDVEGGYMRTTPTFVTNSKALDFLNKQLFVGKGEPDGMGVKITLYRVL